MKHLFGLLLTALVATAASSTWAMLAAPHQLTDPAFVVLALGFAVGSLGLDRVYRVFRVGRVE